ncbi:MAG TPA: pitrilysin family protein [Myxococcaceae bacterium]|nr:pitrilysin family protein [Myxococcaceae bacterium]
MSRSQKWTPMLRGSAVFAALAIAQLSCSGTRPERKAETPSGAKVEAPAPAAFTPDEGFRSQKPPPLQRVSSFQAPVPTERRLKNGLSVLVVENHEVALVSIEVMIKTGVNGEPVNKAGLSTLVASTLTEGTQSRSASQFAEQLENLAAELSARSEQSATRIHLRCLSETLQPAMDLLADAVQHPAFRPQDLERARALQLTMLRQKRSTPEALARDEMDLRLYGSKHPWGQPVGGTEPSVQALTRQDLVSFFQAWYRPNNAVISVAGDVNTDQVVKALDEKLAGWKAKPVRALRLPSLPGLAARSISTLEVSGATQSQIWVGGRLFPANHRDALPVQVGNLILGGLFTSRLNRNLREDKGYSYGVFSITTLGPTTGTLIAAGGVVSKNTVEALVEYEKELEKFSNGDFTDEELTQAKAALIGRLPSRLETNDAVAGAMNSLVLNRLPLDYFQTLPSQTARLGKDEVARAIRKYVAPRQWPVVVVGPIQADQDRIRQLGLGPVASRP